MSGALRNLDAKDPAAGGESVGRPAVGEPKGAKEFTGLVMRNGIGREEANSGECLLVGGGANQVRCQYERCERGMSRAAGQRLAWRAEFIVLSRALANNRSPGAGRPREVAPGGQVPR